MSEAVFGLDRGQHLRQTDLLIRNTTSKKIAPLLGDMKNSTGLLILIVSQKTYRQSCDTFNLSQFPRLVSNQRSLST